jgi:hypothetical protein
MSAIPIYVICYNSLYFIRNFLKQLERFPNPVVILDNASTYPDLLAYYDEVQIQWGDCLTIHRLHHNYGHTVYHIRHDLMPEWYVISDPDLELHPNMPVDAVEQLYQLALQYNTCKIGLAIDISEPEKFIDNPRYNVGKSIVQWEEQFWYHRIENNDKYKLYHADIDTTFCLVHHPSLNTNKSRIRVADTFTCKHLPWYKGYITKHISPEEISYWKQNNISSSILWNCSHDI